MDKRFIQCYCGIMRALPDGLKEGDQVHLVPCPKCGQPLHGEFCGNGVITRD